jgi:ribosome maturation protein SDO1
VRDIVQLVVERCVHPQSGRQLTAITVDNALKTVGFSVHPDHSAKKQALKAIETLCTELPDSFARAKMRLRITFPGELQAEIKNYLTDEARAKIEEDTSAAGGAESSTVHALTFVCEPSRYRDLDRLATSTHKDRGVTLQIVTATVLREEGNVDDAPPVAGASGAPAAFSPPERATATQELPPAANTGAEAAVGVCRRPEETASAPKKGLRCSSCAASFEDPAVYRQHCKSKWHLFNLKRKVKGLEPVNEDEFLEFDLDEREGFLAVD